MNATRQKITLMRDDAQVLRRNLCTREAELLEAWAAELECAVIQDENELLTRSEALRFSRYSDAQFRALERAGLISAINTAEGARYRKSELPRRPQSASQRMRKPKQAPEVHAAAAGEMSLIEQIRASARSAARRF